MKQRGLSDQVITWIIGIVLSAASGAGGVFMAYSGIKQDIAVIKTEIRYTRDDVKELQDDVKELLREPSP